MSIVATLLLSQTLFGDLTSSSGTPPPARSAPESAPVPVHTLEPASASKLPAKFQEDRFRKPYLLLAPGLLTYGLAIPWGINAGVSVSGRRANSLLSVGGFFEHLIGLRHLLRPPGYPRNVTHSLHVGAEFRLGRMKHSVFGYGLFRLGLDFEVDLKVLRAAALLASLGGGFQALLPHRFLIGAEIVADGAVAFYQNLPPEASSGYLISGNLLAKLLLGMRF